MSKPKKSPQEEKFITNRNPHAKLLQVKVCNCGCGQSQTCCPTCGVGLDDLDEPHRSPLLFKQEAYDQLVNSYNDCQWPHPEDVLDESGEPIMYKENIYKQDGSFSFEINCFKKTIEYPDEHPYWNWMNEYSKQFEVFQCPGPKYSQSCYPWIGDKNGPTQHEKCNEECYCHCHYAVCICPDLDKGVNPRTLAIVCPIHGHVYTKVTTKDL